MPQNHEYISNFDPSALGYCLLSANDPIADVTEFLILVIPAKAGIALGKCYCTIVGGWVYIMSNRSRGVLYIGVTADLAARVQQHRCGKDSAFCRRYGLDRLVHVEHFSEIDGAIRRKKAMKAWKRQWKIELVEKNNPAWDDLFDLTL